MVRPKSWLWYSSVVLPLDKSPKSSVSVSPSVKWGKNITFHTLLVKGLLTQATVPSTRKIFARIYQSLLFFCVKYLLLSYIVSKPKVIYECSEHNIYNYILKKNYVVNKETVFHRVIQVPAWEQKQTLNSSLCQPHLTETLERWWLDLLLLVLDFPLD